MIRTEKRFFSWYEENSLETFYYLKFDQNKILFLTWYIKVLYL